MFLSTRTPLAVVVLLGASTLAFGQVTQQPTEYLDVQPIQGQEPPMLGIHWARGVIHPDGAQALAPARTRRTPNMTYHGGKILPTTNVYPIFWGTSWPNYSGDKLTGTDSFYAGFDNSDYAATSDEYTGAGQEVSPTVIAKTHVVDSSAASGGGSTATIQNEVCKVIANGLTLDTSGNGYYPVYTDVKRGNAGYCAWHANGSCNGHAIQFAFFFNLDGDPGCDPGDAQTGHSQGLAAIANVSAHELSEARTDPDGNAWYDGSGNENGDKCAWTFNVAYVTFHDGTKWKVQGEWSNNAYNTGTGYPNSSGQKGCLDGH